MPSSFDPNSVWLITGCSTGLGRSLSKHIHEAGYNVVATARNLEALSYLPDGPKVLQLSLDVTSKKDITTALESVIARFGRLDVLINNAGFSSLGEAEGFPEDIARGLLETNFWGAATMTRESIRIFRDVNPTKQQGGTIVQVSSISGCFAFGGSPFYDASKFALEGFSKSVAKELKPEWNINILIASPGGMATSWFQNMKFPARPQVYADDPEVPLNQLLAQLGSVDPAAVFPPPEKCAKAIVDSVLGQRDRPLPVRLNLGPELLPMIRGDVGRTLSEMEEWEDVTMSVTGAQSHKMGGTR